MNLLGLALLSAAAVSGQPTGDFHHDFRGGQLDEGGLKRIGPDTDKFIHQEAEGLRITLPAANGPEAPVGVALRGPVRGDFEITASFTILQTEQPKSGYGAGVVLQIIKDSEAQELASMTRTWRPREGEAFVATYRVTKPEGKPATKRMDYPSKSRSGQLRLVRQGGLLHFLCAEGDQDSFREIYQANFGTEDLRTIRLVADTGKANNLLDVRLESLSLHTDAPNRSSSLRWSVWIVISLAAALFFLAGCLVSVWFRRRKPAAPSQPAAAKPKERPTVAAKPSPPRSS